MARKTARRGMKVRVTKNFRDPYSSTTIQQGTILTLGEYRTNCSVWEASDEDGDQVHIDRDRFTIVESNTKETLENELKAAKASMADVETKLAYLKETGSDEFDETEFKCYRALQALKSESSDIEKAKVIAKLVKEGGN